MTTQILTIGKRRFVVVPEQDFLKLQKRAAKETVRSEFAEDAMKELRKYRKTGVATPWPKVKRKLGL